MNTTPVELHKSELEAEGLTIQRKLHAPSTITLKWARAKRREVPVHWRFCFDVEADPELDELPDLEKIKIINQWKKELGLTDFMDLPDWNRWMFWLKRHPAVRQAITVWWGNMYKMDKFKKHIKSIGVKAEESDDANKLINLHRYIDHYNLNIMELLNLKDRKRQKRNGKDHIIDIDVEEKRAIEAKYAEGVKE